MHRPHPAVPLVGTGAAAGAALFVVGVVAAGDGDIDERGVVRGIHFTDAVRHVYAVIQVRSEQVGCPPEPLR